MVSLLDCIWLAGVTKLVVLACRAGIHPAVLLSPPVGNLLHVVVGEDGVGGYFWMALKMFYSLAHDDVEESLWLVIIELL